MSLLTDKIFICDACLFDCFVESMPQGWTEYGDGPATMHRCPLCNNPNPVTLPQNEHLKRRFTYPDVAHKHA